MSGRRVQQAVLGAMTVLVMHGFGTAEPGQVTMALEQLEAELGITPGTLPGHIEDRLREVFT